VDSELKMIFFVLRRRSFFAIMWC